MKGKESMHSYKLATDEERESEREREREKMCRWAVSIDLCSHE